MSYHLGSGLRCSTRGSKGVRDQLLDPLMRPGPVEVVYVHIEDPLELLLLQDEQMIETFATHTAQKAFTDRIGAWRAIRCFQNLDAAGGGHTSKTGTIFAITIPNEILRPLSKRSCFPQLLCGPGVCRRVSDAHVYDSARGHIDNEKGKERTKEEI